MKLVMFSPQGEHLKRGWPGRVENDRVIQLAAQTLQSFFTGGGKAREHASTSWRTSTFARRSSIRPRSATSTRSSST